MEVADLLLCEVCYVMELGLAQVAVEVVQSCGLEEEEQLMA